MDWILSFFNNLCIEYANIFYIMILANTCLLLRSLQKRKKKLQKSRSKIQDFFHSFFFRSKRISQGRYLLLLVRKGAKRLFSPVLSSASKIKTFFPSERERERKRKPRACALGTGRRRESVSQSAHFFPFSVRGKNPKSAKGKGRLRAFLL